MITKNNLRHLHASIVCARDCLVFCVWGLRTWQGIFPQRHFISLATLYLVFFASVFMSSLDLAYHSFVAKSPNHAMQLTGSARHGSCFPQTRRGSYRAALRL
jgi:hypothetical protein